MFVASRKPFLVALLLVPAVIAAACGDSEPESVAAGETDSARSTEEFAIGAIPDQTPEKLQRLYGLVAEYLSEELDVTVNYVPVTDYTAAVGLFNVGDLDMVFFGGLTGVQARLQLEGSESILQRDIDEAFHSVFIANKSANIAPFEELEGLTALEGKTFTFGSEQSTSGRLMPQFFMEQGGVTPADFAGEAGFSGSHDKTAELVQAGTFQAGVLNEQVWEARKEAGQVDTSLVDVVFRTPAYHDYHWIVRPDLKERDGGEFVDRVKTAFMDLSADDPREAEILELFGAGGFIETNDGNYDEIEEIGRKLGLIT